MKLSEQIKSKIEKQKAVGHDSAAVVSYEMLNRWLDEAHELEQKLNLHSIMQASESASAEGAAVGQRSVGTVAEARDCGCTYSIDCDERKDCVKKQIDADFARKSSEGQP